MLRGMLLLVILVVVEFDVKFIGLIRCGLC